MRQRFRVVVILFACLFSLSLPAEELIKLATRDGVSQSFLFDPVEEPRATVLLFPGGAGYLKLREDGRIRRGKNNFLVRSRGLFTAAGFNVAVFEAPSDHQHRRGMKGGFRASEAHAVDVAAVVNYLREQAAVPVWLVGTSRGTESVANVAIRQPTLMNGIVLTASISEENGNGVSLPEMALEQVQVPVLLGTHADDACWVTPPRGSEAIKQALVSAGRVALKIYRGGLAAKADDCQGLSAHGFYGIEDSVVSDMIAFIQTPARQLTQRDPVAHRE